ncbi:tetratricopeptide repeat protein [Psychroserpens sp. XS_ASV72]|uniref:tetratricopeptide repeat protein n=1 Tax=Psychroserpens sp. XS_ASV72 TaxID=3241293 RepID=UPI00351917D7
MKTYTLLLMVFILSVITNAQELNKEITTESETPFLLGRIDKNGLTAEPYNDWFSKNYEAYDLDENTIEKLKRNLKNFQITLFMGTWCGDSKREVPRFYKILDACGFPEDQLTVIALSKMPYMYKQSPNHYEAGLNIHRVPTFIIHKGRREINRIVEEPVVSLEKDLLNIVTENSYQSNYQIVSQIDNILKNDGLNGLKRAHKKLVKQFDSKVSSMYELNTYGKILYSTNRNDESIEVFKLNNSLFPNEPRTYMSLANTLGVNEYKDQAIEVMEKAIQRFPDNKDLVENLNAIKTRETQ